MFYERDYFIHYYDSDLKKQAAIQSLLRFFEDIAILHSEHVKLGIDYYHRHNVGWVLYKWDIKIIRYPEFKETVKVRTSASYLKSFHAYRYFDVLDLNGEQIATANSMWLFINPATRKPVYITEDIFKGYSVDKNKMTHLEFGEINNLKMIDAQKEFDIRYIDIDTNNHVNNIKYVDWALELVPVNILREYTLNRLKVNYKKEISYGKNVISSINIEDEGEKIKCIHQISSNETLLCQLETNWKHTKNTFT